MCGPGKTNKRAVNIQARSFMARALDKIGKKCRAEGEAHNGPMNNRNSIMPEDYEEYRIYFIDPEDTEFKETIKNARKKLETPMAPAMPCKTSKTRKHGETRGKTNEIKSKLACILEASEWARLRMRESLPNHHEDHIAGKGDNSLQHYNLVRIFIPMPQAMKIPAAKAAVDKEWENCIQQSFLTRRIDV